MNATTSYGNFTNFAPESATLADYIAGALGDYAADYDLTAIETEVRAALNAALPEGVSLAGNELYGPYDERSREIDYPAVLGRVDFWEIAARHENARY